MISLLKPIFWFLVSLTAPIVCLVYRRGWYNTPDDPDSPHGQKNETEMRWLLAHAGVWFTDYWWLGFRNRALGLAYALKPEHFKQLDSYAECVLSRKVRGKLTVTTVDGYNEYVWKIGGFAHFIYGYRMTPIFDEVTKNRDGAGIPFKKIDMAARPIISLRHGRPD